MDLAVFAPAMGPLLAHPSAAAPGGAQVQILMLTRALAARGHRVGIMVVSDGSVELPGERDGVAVIELASSTPRRLLMPGLSFSAWTAALARQLASVRACTYLHRGASAEAGVVAIAARLCRRRYVYASASVVDFDFDQLERRPPYAALFRLGVRAAHALVVQSEEQAGLCRARFGREPLIIPSLTEAGAPPAGSARAFLWAGRLAPYKRPERLLELARALPDARFVIVGGADLSDGGRAAKTMARDCAVMPNVDFLGECSRERVLELMHSAVAVVSTSEWEGMPNVFLEGWARGVPALSLSHDPDGAIERERLGGFAHGSRERFAGLARELWTTRDARAELSDRCRSYIAREHGLEAAVARWERALGLTPPMAA